MLYGFKVTIISGHFTFTFHKVDSLAVATRISHNYQVLLDNGTVEQEIFATGNFRDFRAEAIRVQENFANQEIEGVISFKMSPCLSNSDQ